MDITRFINSRDIRKHLKKIGYQFTSLEAAWLIGDCKSITLEERHASWRELIRTMPDMKIESRHLTREWPSLHGYLEKRMVYENHLYEAFLTKETGAVYTCSVWLKKSTSDNGCYNDYGNYLYSDFTKCQADVNETYHDEIMKSRYEKIHKIQVRKQFADNDHREITADFNAQWELISIWKNGKIIDDICAEQDDFDGLWFSFPTPFTKGDIVINAEPCVWQYGEGLFVLDSIPPTEEDYIASHQKDADTSDMIAVGYFQEEDGSIYWEVMHNYMNLEYYRGDMTGKCRILKALSSFMKDKIDISLYSKAYHAILMDEYAKSVVPEHFTDEGMRLAGFCHKRSGEMNKLEEQVRDIKAITDKYWEAHEGCEPAEPSQEFIERIDALVSEYGYRSVADAFGIKTRQLYYEFDEYTTDAELFESDVDVLSDEDDELFVYKAYCQWRPYWPVLISSESMNHIKAYQSRVRHCHGEFFTLTKKKLRLAAAVLNQLWEWEAGAFDWQEEDCQYLMETQTFSITDADFEQMHAKTQSSHIKAITLELIENSQELPLEAIKAYTLCQTRSVTPDGWGPDIYVLSESDREEIMRALVEKVGADVAEKLFEPADTYHLFYLWGIDDRSEAFGIFFNEKDIVIPSYRPNVDIEKYLFPEFPLKREDNMWSDKHENANGHVNADDEIPI